MDNYNNNIYQGLIPKIKLPIIKTLRPNKDRQAVIAQQPAPSPTVMKSSGIFLVPGDDDMGQHISPINKPVPQEILVIWRKENNTGSNIHTKHHA